MTVIAWDGKTLSADKQMTHSGLKRTITKIKRIDGLLVGGCGDADKLPEVFAWVERGRSLDSFPESFKSEDADISFVVIDRDADGKPLILSYASSPLPILIEDVKYAKGSGRDYALAAMYLGESSRAAVEVACVFDSDCGLGIDTLSFED